MRNKPIQSITSVLGCLLMAVLVTTADTGYATSIATLGGGDPSVSPQFNGESARCAKQRLSERGAVAIALEL